MPKTVDVSNCLRPVHIMYSGNYLMALVSSPADGRKTCHRMTNCRDFLHEFIRLQIHECRAPKACCDPSLHGKIDLQRLRLLVVATVDDGPAEEAFKERMFNAKRIINMYEDLAGWDKTKITLAELAGLDEATEHNTVVCSWLLTAPVQWLNSPHMLSMFTLIIKAVSIAEVMDASKMPKKATDLPRFWANYRGTYKQEINAVHKHFPVLLKNYELIFVDGTNEAYGKELEKFHSCGGIRALCHKGTAGSRIDHLYNKALFANVKQEK